MPETPAVDEQALEQWFAANVGLLVIIAVFLLILYAFSGRIMHAAVSRALATQKRQAEPGSPEAVELDKRAATLSSLATAVLRIVVVGVMVTLVIGFFGLWGLLAGAGLFLAALTLAGQPIVLDYLMGILIILEGQYFKGDVIASGTVVGTVEDVGLRRTTVRSVDGTVHSLSNGEIRIVSNRTRVFAAAEVTIPGIREEDLERVLELMDAVGRDVALDPRFTALIIETPSVQFIGDPDDLGMTATMRGKVLAGERWTVATEIRRRLNRAFVEAGIVLNKRGVVPRERRGLDQAALYVPEAGDD
jgi:moderate conductance mechanosensitive channel